ncbi:MAG: SGNH/GDSL hydrolase family protein [Desulfobacterales bacterium]|nr:SGNH/GDSL hydrolase family protein [Pseudomonadota bacterium]MBU4357399.1 SGNH/GDSL hydrolase family protein [Pseudomonadota bacterium]MCG2772408.1 SGNH/GDSL hydrolase family protein [Desulfobacterales bacterium]
MSKVLLKHILAVVIGLLLSFILLEGLLRIFQPIEYRLRGNKIWLPQDRKYQLTNDKTDKLDKIVYTTRNHMGFRGEPPPKNFAEYFTIIAVGGSTTASELISDHKTWCDLLAVKLKSKFKSLWLNNAGLDGHSTYGHIVLMEDYIIRIRPKVVLFLVGANDIGLETSRIYDKGQFKKPLTGLFALWDNLVNKSEVLNYSINFCRFFKAKRRGLTHTLWNFHEMHQFDIPAEKVPQILIEQKQKYLTPYAERLNRLIEISRQNSIEPVLITQPSVLGDLVDPTTGINLARVNYTCWNGKVFWQVLELYNDVVRNIAAEHHVGLIDLAREMPKRTEYYYDMYHFSNTGCQKVAEIVYQNLYPLLENMQFPTGKLRQMKEDVR